MIFCSGEQVIQYRGSKQLFVCIIMRPAGIYLVQAQIGEARITTLPEGDILLTLRIGRNYASASYSRTSHTPSIMFNTTLQLNVDSSALDTQRCSLTMNLNTPQDKRMIGIALISLPKDKNQVSNSYRLTQNQDKKAEVDIKIKIISIDGSSLRGPNTLGLNSESTAKIEETKPDPEPIKEAIADQTSNIKVKSKASEQRSNGSQIKKPPLKNFKSDGDKTIQVSQAEFKRLKDQKEVYYQMYQIQKSKNEVASKFINTFIKKVAEKFPNLVPNPTDILQCGKRTYESPTKKQADSSAAMAQLEQANRSLHRQLDQFKKINEQLKQQLFASSKIVEETPNKKNNLLTPSFIDLAMIPKHSHRQKSSIVPSVLKEPQHSALTQAKPPNDLQKQLRQAFADLDLKKWLEQSIGHRQEVQSKFTPSSSMQQDRVESKTNFVKKLRSGIDKAFAQLFLSKDLTKAALLTHKQEVNRLLDENTF